MEVELLIQRLKAALDILPNKSGQTHRYLPILLPLEAYYRSMPIDVEYGKYIPPSEYDILLTDITKTDCMDVSRNLGSSHLAKIDGQSNLPIQGIFKGDNNRMFACLTVKKRGSARNVCCLYDTGSPYTYLSEETLALLGYSENVPEQAEVVGHELVETRLRIALGHLPLHVQQVWDADAP
ncbi:hypothetical protein WJX77_009507 [Trebouxia sp. C0004]